MSVNGIQISTEVGPIRAGSMGLITLAAVAVIQGFILLSLNRGKGNGDPWLREGDNLGLIRATTAHGDPAALASGQPLLLLVFHPECGHCQDVVPIWRDWVQTREPTIRVVAATSAHPEAANAFLLSHSWEPVLWIIEPKEGIPARRPVTTRTPWIFLLDGDGVILAEGHGRRIEEIGLRMPGILQLEGWIRE